MSQDIGVALNLHEGSGLLAFGPFGAGQNGVSLREANAPDCEIVTDCHKRRETDAGHNDRAFERRRITTGTK
jgi:hypothetical protein